MILSPRTKEHMRGDCRILTGRPTIEEHRSVYYVPHVEGGKWGIFDMSDKAVEITVERGTAEMTPLRQVPHSPLRYADVESVSDSRYEYIYGGRFVNHFGHFLIETLARFWPFRNGFRPNQLVVMHGDATPADWFSLPHVRSVFGALKLSQDRIVHASVPFRVERLVVAEPSFRPQAFAYPAFVQLCRLLGERLCGGLARTKHDSRPVYLSKTRLTGGVALWQNEAVVQDKLRACGVEVIHPQDMSIADHIRLFASRKTVCGVIGSAHHVSAFTEECARFVLLSPERPNSNFFLIDELNKNNAEYYFAQGTRNVPGSNPNFIVERTIEDPYDVAEALLAKL